MTVSLLCPPPQLRVGLHLHVEKLLGHLDVAGGGLVLLPAVVAGGGHVLLPALVGGGLVLLPVVAGDRRSAELTGGGLVLLPGVARCRYVLLPALDGGGLVLPPIVAGDRHVLLPALAGGDVLLLAGGRHVLRLPAVVSGGHVLLHTLDVLAGSIGKY